MEPSSWNHQQEPGVTNCVSAEPSSDAPEPFLQACAEHGGLQVCAADSEIPSLQCVSEVFWVL